MRLTLTETLNEDGGQGTRESLGGRGGVCIGTLAGTDSGSQMAARSKKG